MREKWAKNQRSDNAKYNSSHYDRKIFYCKKTNTLLILHLLALTRRRSFTNLLTQEPAQQIVTEIKGLAQGSFRDGALGNLIGAPAHGAADKSGDRIYYGNLASIPNY